MEDEKKSPGDVIVETVKEASDFLAELSDKAIEIASESEVFEHVPVISWAVKVLKVRDNYQRYRLKRNCEALLRSLSGFSQADLNAFQQELSASRVTSEEFSDTTFSILLESQKPIKAGIYGHLLSARIKGSIGHDEFEKLAHIIQAASLTALNSLGDFFARTEGLPFHNTPSALPEEPLLLSLGVGRRYGTNFRISELGQTLYATCKSSFSKSPTQPSASSGHDASTLN